ncbi:heparan-sulfate 6-O-sulfotransferase 2 [Podarcis lilfordi]|uniref:Heparan-sulfate 6-O-sulfotransferase n=1 Tax=Podarcis lilfordi TaxID=74358 RepID=A0AA35PPP6_9SAUR|nr:heparan-sulfate 6-O-sulfotransferase 2 [Podarcis lilfordi]
MEERWHRGLAALVMLLLFGGLVLQYVCPGSECQLRQRLAEAAPSALLARQAGQGGDPYRAEDESPPRFVPRLNFSEADLLRRVDFHIAGDDLIVFLHIQKTGGTTFGRHLVRNIQLEQPCECKAGQKKCTCLRPGKRETWLFSRFSTGWSCGLHADWTELTNCVPAVVDSKKDAKLRPTSREIPTDGAGPSGVAGASPYYVQNNTPLDQAHAPSGSAAQPALMGRRRWAK